VKITETLKKALDDAALPKIKRWPAKVERSVNKSLEDLFHNPTEQQYLYDTSEIATLIPSLHVALNSNLTLTDKSRLVARKLSAHSAYSDPKLYNAAVRLFDEIQEDVQALRDSRLKTWYRVFSVDHAISRLYGGSAKTKDKRTDLINSFQSLVDVSNPPDYLRLRVAHFHGHQGNYYLRALQHLELSDSAEVWRDQISKLSSSAIKHFKSAVEFRTTNQTCDSLINDTKGTYSKYFNVSRRGSIEAWHSLAQAFADTANQLSCLVCVACYQCLLDTKHIKDVQRYSSAATRIWDALRREVTLNKESTPYRVIDRRRISEHMLYHLSSHFPKVPRSGVEPTRYSVELKTWEKDLLQHFRNGLDGTSKK
jgi:hypothetical protein